MVGDWRELWWPIKRNVEFFRFVFASTNSGPTRAKVLVPCAGEWQVAVIANDVVDLFSSIVPYRSCVV